MPRHASGRHEAQRERQRRYRQRLRESGTPEASAVDVAVSAAMSAMAEAIRRADEDARAAVRRRREALECRLRQDDLTDEEFGAIHAELMLAPALPQQSPLPPAEFVRRILHGAVALLVDRGCDPAAARRMVVRRLGRGGDVSMLDDLIMRSGISVAPRRPHASRRDVA